MDIWGLRWPQTSYVSATVFSHMVYITDKTEERWLQTNAVTIVPV